MPALLILSNLRPALKLAEQLHRYQQQLDFDEVRPRFESLAGENLPGIRAVELAKYALDAPERGAFVFTRLDPDRAHNALLSHLQVAWSLGERPSRDPLSRFGEIRGLLEDARSAPALDWHTTEAMRAWRSAFRDTNARADVNARLARNAACRSKARIIRLACERSLSLADELIDAEHPEQARVCVRASAELCRKTIERVFSADVALACAEGLEQALDRESMLLAGEQRWAKSLEVQVRARGAGRFREILRARRAGATSDPFLNLPVLRQQPYRQAVSYLLVSGILLVGWGTLLLVGLVCSVAGGIARLLRRAQAASEPSTVGPRPQRWLWAGVIVAGPTAFAAAAVLLIPLDPQAALSLSWIQAMLVLTAVLTGAACLSLGRARVSSGRDLPGPSRVWGWWWVAVAVVTGLVLLRPWSPFGDAMRQFDEGLRTPQALERLYLIQLMVVFLSALGVLVWIGWSLVSWIRRRKQGSPERTRGPAGGIFRSATVLAVWGWLILGIMSLGAIKLYHRYDSRLAELTAHDLEDEVAGWMGPVWKYEFFEARAGQSGPRHEDTTQDRPQP